jgi:very-short-patch-repair endonuclease
MSAAAWSLATRQKDVVTCAQLLELGYSRAAIRHRLATGRLHVVHRGVYAVGRRRLTREGEYMAAVLACGPTAALSHESSAALWQVRPERYPRIEVSVAGGQRIVPGIVVHEQRHRTVHRRHGIPVTSLTDTLIDLAVRLTTDQLEAAISQADILGLITPERLRRNLEKMPPRRGVGVLRRTLDRRSFRVTRSKLERHFLAIVRRAGLPMPLTRVHVNGYEVDFYWPDLGLVVETDGLTYHRTPADQAADRLRDQTHIAAGLTPLRFTRYQVVHEPDHVEAIFSAVAKR